MPEHAPTLHHPPCPTVAVVQPFACRRRTTEKRIIARHFRTSCAACVVGEPRARSTKLNYPPYIVTFSRSIGLFLFIATKLKRDTYRPMRGSGTTGVWHQPNNGSIHPTPPPLVVAHKRAALLAVFSRFYHPIDTEPEVTAPRLPLTWTEEICTCATSWAREPARLRTGWYPSPRCVSGAS